MYVGSFQGLRGDDGLLGAAGEQGPKVNCSAYKNHIMKVFYYEMFLCVTLIYF